MTKPPTIPPILPSTPATHFGSSSTSKKHFFPFPYAIATLLAIPLFTYGYIFATNFSQGYKEATAYHQSQTELQDAIQINDQAFVMNMININPQSTYEKMNPTELTREDHAQNTLWLRTKLQATTPKIEHLETTPCQLNNTPAIRSIYKIHGQPEVCFITIYHPKDSTKFDKPIAYHLRG